MKDLKHSLGKKFNKTFLNGKKHKPKPLLEDIKEIGRGIGVNKLTDFAGSHYRDDDVRHIHKQVHKLNDVSKHFNPKIGDEINNLIPFSITRKYK